MRRGLVVLLLVLVCAPAARAEALAPDVAAKVPMAVTVMCATDEADWQAQVQRLHGAPGTRGMTQVNSGVIHLPPTTCAAARFGTFNPAFALEYRTLYHEFIHADLHTADESVAECVSLFMYRYWLRHFFGASAKQAQAAYAVAWNDHRTLPPAYLGSCSFSVWDGVSALNG